MPAIVPGTTRGGLVQDPHIRAGPNGSTTLKSLSLEEAGYKGEGEGAAPSQTQSKSPYGETSYFCMAICVKIHLRYHLHRKERIKSAAPHAMALQNRKSGK